MPRQNQLKLFQVDINVLNGNQLKKVSDASEKVTVKRKTEANFFRWKYCIILQIV